MTRRHAVAAVLRYEWQSAIALRSSLVLLTVSLLSAASTILMANSLAPAALLVEGSVPFGGAVAYAPMSFLAVMLFIFGSMSLGHDYRYRRILILHAAVPRRALSYVAKLLFVLGIGCASTLLVVSLGVVGTWLNGDGVVFSGERGMFALFAVVGGNAFLAAAFYVVAGASATALTGSMMWGLLTPVLVSAIAEPILSMLLSDRAPWLTYALPFSGVRNILGQGLGAPAPGGAPVQYAIVAAWFAVIVVSGGYRYVRREW